MGLYDILETVKTVEKIAASKVHLLREKNYLLNKYTKEIENILSRLSLYDAQENSTQLHNTKSEEKLLIIITGNNGLVGGLWHDIINFFIATTNNYNDIVILGKKGNSYLQEGGITKILKSFSSKNVMFAQEEINSVTDYAFDLFNAKKYTSIDILFPKFESLSQQTPDIVPFLPFVFKADTTTKDVSDKPLGLPIFEPSKKKIYKSLLEKYILVYFDMIITEAQLSEFAARTITMEHATAKTKELIKEKNILYTKQRRKTMTSRQLESFTSHKIHL